MHRFAWLVLAACGSSPPGPTLGNAEPAPPPSPRTLELRAFVDAESGSKHELWIEPGREGGVDTHDPCCGVAYDGNKYDDALATCGADLDADDDGCQPGTTGVYPGLADDRVCGGRRRCVALPAVRVVVEDGTPVTAHDAEDEPIAVGGANVSHRQVHVPRDGVVSVLVAGQAGAVAVDYGARYTVVVRAGHIERVTRD